MLVLIAIAHEQTHSGESRVTILRMQPLGPICDGAFPLIRAQPVHRQRALIPQEPLANFVEFPYPEIGRARREFETLIEVLEMKLVRTLRSNVRLVRNEIDERACGVAHGLHVNDLPERSSGPRVVENLNLARLPGAHGFAQAGDSL